MNEGAAASVVPDLGNGEGGAGAGGGEGAGSGAASGGANDAWFSGFDDDTKGWVSARGLDKLDPTAALPELIKGYRGAESKLGVPADQLIRMPGKDATPEDWKAVYQKLGAPENADGYELPVPEGDSGEFAKQAAGWFAEIGVPKAMAAGLASKWNEHVSAMQEAQEQRWEQDFNKQIGALKSEWTGEEYDKNVDLAKRVMRNSGWTQDQLQAIERSLGPKAMLQGFANYGRILGEHRFIDAGGSQQFGMTIEGARARLGDLKKDTAWMASYIGGDVDKKSEWKRLHEVAFPEESAA